MKTLLEYAINQKNAVANNVVDLNLPSRTLWCTKNLGAKTLYDSGDYYAWGDTKTRVKYSPDNYVFSPESFVFSKYNDDDNLIELEDCDNVVKKELSNKYDMPTLYQFIELHEHTTLKIDNKNNCAIFTGNNDKQLIIPFGGWYGAGGLIHTNETYRLWSKTLLKNDIDYAWSAKYNSNKNKCDVYDTSRHLGGNIRAVINK